MVNDSRTSVYFGTAMNAASWTVCLPKTRSDFADDEFRRKRSTACLRSRGGALVHESRGLGVERPGFARSGWGVAPTNQTTGMRSRIHPTYKTKYGVANWASYDRACRSSGSWAWTSPFRITQRSHDAGSPWISRCGECTRATVFISSCHGDRGAVRIVWMFIAAMVVATSAKTASRSRVRPHGDQLRIRDPGDYQDH